MTGLKKDFHKGLFVRGIIRDELRLTWQVRRGDHDEPLGELRVCVGPVEFRQCEQPGGRLYEGESCAYHPDERFDPLRTLRVIRDPWIFALEMDGPAPLRFFYELHLLLPCSGDNCPLVLDPETQQGRDCGCGRPWTDQLRCPGCGKLGGALDNAGCGTCHGDFAELEKACLIPSCRRVWRKQSRALDVIAE